MASWFKVYRKIFDCPAFDGERFSKREAWIYLVSRANHQEKNVRGMKIDRGQFHDSIERLAMVWKWNRKTVSAFLDFLEKEEMIIVDKERYGTTKGTMITIVNYGLYQGSMDNETDIKTDIKLDIKTDIKTDINKNIKNNKNTKNNINTSEKSDAIVEDFEKLYSRYPKKAGKKRALQIYRQWVTVGRDDGTGKKVKLTNKIIWNAMIAYIKSKGTDADTKYWKNFDTLMNNITDYVLEEGEQGDD